MCIEHKPPTTCKTQRDIHVFLMKKKIWEYAQKQQQQNTYQTVVLC